MEEELLPSTLKAIPKIPVLSIADPGPLQVFCRCMLNKLGPFCGAKVPDGMHIVVFSQYAGQVVPVPCQNVDHASRNIGRVKNLQKVSRGWG